MGAWPTKIIFWTAICISCAWLVVAAAFDVGGFISFFAGGFGSSGRSLFEILIVFGLTAIPVAVLFLILRAIRRRASGRPFWVLARAVCPLIPAAFLVTYLDAVQYLDFLTHARLSSTGSITYVCSTKSRTFDYDPKTIGTIELKLTEYRHPGSLGVWAVEWPGKKPIEAKSFRARTGSIGGSQGITWLEPNGQRMTAYLSFSDILSKYGPAGIWVSVLEGDPPEKAPGLFSSASPIFFCGPDPASRRP